MHQKKKIFVTNHHSGRKHYMKKFPRHLIKSYPEGVLYESMKAIHNLCSNEVDYRDGKDFVNFCDQTHAMERWMRAKKRLGMNKLFSQFLKSCNWDFKYYMFHLMASRFNNFEESSRH